MSEKEKEQLAKVGEVEVEALSDEELDNVAGGLEGSSNDCCTCSGNNCSPVEKSPEIEA